MSNKIRSLVVAIVATAFTAFTFAGEGAIPLYGPMDIDAPGKYVVTQNISVGGGSIFQIQADGVEVDLNGMKLDSGSSTEPVIVTNGADELWIHNGTINGGSKAIEVDTGEGLVFEDLRITGQEPDGEGGIVVVSSCNVTVRRVAMRNRNGTAILIDGAGADVSGAFVYEVQVKGGTDGIVIQGVDNVSVVMAQVSVPGLGILISDGNTVIVEKNVVYRSVDAIRLSNVYSAVVSVNAVDDVDRGVVLESAINTKIYNNVVANAAVWGMVLNVTSHDALMLDNVVSGCSAGVLIEGSRVTVVRNLFNNNTAHGLEITGNDCVYRQNTAVGNNGLVCTGGVSTPGMCDEGTNNQSAGDNFMPSLL